MFDKNNITALRMERQHLTRKANKTEYIDFYRDLQPGQNVYWNGFGDPPSLTYRADFNDIELNPHLHSGARRDIISSLYIRSKDDGIEEANRIRVTHQNTLG